jgi:hypothetical protein
VLSGALAGVLSLTACAALTSCAGSGGSGGVSGNSGGSSRDAAPAAPPPGRYQTLPEPCGSVDGGTLRLMLPDSQNYAGTSALTYDPDRRAGCQWTGTVQGGTRYLSVDFERVVSYDPTVSADDKAAQEYEQMALAAHIPDANPSASPGPSTPPSHGASPGPGGTAPAPAPSSPAPGATSPAPGAPAAAPPSGPSSPPASVAPAPSDSAEANDTTPRRVGGMGDAAYLNDALTTMDSAVHRDVTLVFRISNVLVTVKFSQRSNDKSVIPPSGELQLGAFGLAQELAQNFSG